MAGSNGVKVFTDAFTPRPHCEAYGCKRRGIRDYKERWICGWHWRLYRGKITDDCC